MSESYERLRRAERVLFADYQLDVKEHMIQLPQAPVRVLEVGEGPPVLLLHGISSLAAHWTPLLEHLRDFRCFVLDWPGHGLSGNFDYRGVHLRRHAVELLGSLLDDLGLERVAVVGNSLGAQFAFYLALQPRQCLGAVVGLGEPAVAFTGARPKGMLLLLATPRLNGLLLSLPSSHLSYRIAMANIAGWHAVRVVPRALLDVGRIAGRLPGHPATVAALMERVNRFRTPREENVLTDAELARIGLPVLFVWGARDPYLSPEAGRVSLDKMPNARLEIVEGGHLPWLDQPARCGDLVAHFLSQLT